ncbi:class I SAM-dependent methyltransferase [Ectobacillus ponti]|uniref:Class I SAM-dependent methyltransferase n=1 Tax=Ectobacillus ponti TaxID=2961894 RepID=A0AA42BS43_9BACI|nr:class I SAM-dependent methyltransferase [Ectobacillus ponti]MCP8968053.1 class I SAM-dependent methyltransferase [Ectobacillus ponti]
MKKQVIIADIASRLEDESIPYEVTGAAALYIQGIDHIDVGEIRIDVQWDVMDRAYEIFQPYAPGEVKRDKVQAAFSFSYEGETVVIACLFNTTVRTQPYRVSVQIEEREVWCRSLYSYLYYPEHAEFGSAIHTFLQERQRAITAQNETAWNTSNYAALLNRHGEPAVVAEKIQQNPEWRLHPFLKYMKDVQGKRVIHLMGSHGIKAVALALLGADVAVVDFSQENAMFAGELAKHAGVELSYVVSDVLSADLEAEAADFVLMELGVLHYYLDLQPLAQIIHRLLKPGGRFVLHEFHPVSVKMITSSGKKHKVDGNYFDPSLRQRQVAFSKHVAAEETEAVLQRKWTMGELVTAFAGSGLIIRILEEEPNHKLHDIGLPKTFTLVAERI